MDSSEASNMFFMLKKWSKDDPYWCLFACQDNEDKIGGHYCLAKDFDIEQITKYFQEKKYQYIISECYYY